jgi:hypothetical protein
VRSRVRVNASARAQPEPVDRITPGTGSGLSAALLPAIERAREWAGDGLRSLIVSGSHATGEAVWAELDGRRLSLSDLDLYAVMRDAAACAAAHARAAAGRSGLARDALSWGLAAPLEVAFVTLDGLTRMPARPGTVELARSGRVLLGDRTVLERLPRWDPAEVSAEERLLLLENRAFELLWAMGEAGGSGGANPASPDSTALAALCARHAVQKTVLDLAAVRTLARGELPASAAARVARARELGAPANLPSWLDHAWEGLEALWPEALAWRSGAPRALPADAAGAEWRAAARAWCAVWWAEREGAQAPRDPWERALATAARAPLARRVRRSLMGSMRGGEAAGALARLRHALAGTPQHRIHGSATVLLLAAAQSPHEPRLSAGALRALAQLGVTPAVEFAAAAAGVVRAWDRGLHAGLRTADAR